MINKDEVETPLKLQKKKEKQYIRKHRNEFDIHSTSKNQERLKTVVIDLRYKWVLKTQCRIFEFFVCVKSKLDENCDEIVYFHVLQRYLL